RGEKTLRTAPAVPGGDQRAAAGEPATDREEALEGRCRRLDDEVDLELRESRADPRHARARVLVDDDDGRHDADRDEVPEHPFDERDARDRHQGFRHRESRLAQTAALTGGDDAAPERTGARHRSSPRKSSISAMTGSPGQQPLGNGTTSPASQMCGIPVARAPAMSRGRESPPNAGRAASPPS